VLRTIRRRLLGPVCRSQDREELADALFASNRVGEREVLVDRVVIAPPVSLTGDVTGGSQLRGDAVSGPFGNAETLADVAQADGRIVRDANENPGMVGQESPIGRGPLAHQH
jgi:hypothetical protein